MSFIAELRRRNVIRMAGLYLVGAWLIVQVAETVLPTFDVPAWVLRAIMIVVALGFFPALIFAWVFELTPEGLKRDEDVDPSRSIAPQTAQRMNRTIIALLVLALAYFGFDKYVLAPQRLASATAEAVADAQPAIPATTEKSIAVLPFENLSSDKDNEYFADGVAEELLNQLAQLPDLQVAGRTSSFAFKDHDEDLREIGRKLGVAYILEGSVRRSQDRVRITAQLVKATDGFHVWSETFDRELTDIFAVQDEISGAITEALKINLLGGASSASVGAKVSVDAYDAYLKGLSAMALRGTENLNAAREYFREALKIDADYVAAMVSLARTDLLIPFYEPLTTDARNELAAEAESLSRRALAIDPDNANAHLALGTLYSEFQWRWKEAGEEIERALVLAPGNAEVANFAGDYFVNVRDRKRAIAMEQRAAELDPQAPFSHWDLGMAYMLVEHYPERAMESAKTARSIAPWSLKPLKILVWCYGQLRQFPEMHQVLEEARKIEGAPEEELLAMEALAAIAEDKRDQAMQVLAKLETLVKSGAGSSAMLGYDYLLLGEFEPARYWLQFAYDQKDPDLVSGMLPLDLERLAANPLTRPILDQPGLKELVEIRKRNQVSLSP